MRFRLGRLKRYFRKCVRKARIQWYAPHEVSFEDTFLVVFTLITVIFFITTYKITHHGVPNVACRCKFGVPFFRDGETRSCTMWKKNRCGKCKPGYSPAEGSCLENKCRCLHGLEATLMADEIDERCDEQTFPYKHKCKPGRCDPGYHFNSTSKICDINKCYCKQGTPAEGQSCNHPGLHFCLSCFEGHRMIAEDDHVCREIDCKNSTFLVGNECLPCPTGKYLDNFNVCQNNICTCHHGEGILGIDCPRHHMHKCRSCEEDHFYFLSEKFKCEFDFQTYLMTISYEKFDELKSQSKDEAVIESSDCLKRMFDSADYKYNNIELIINSDGIIVKGKKSYNEIEGQYYNNAIIFADSSINSFIVKSWRSGHTTFAYAGWSQNQKVGNSWTMPYLTKDWHAVLHDSYNGGLQTNNDYKIDMKATLEWRVHNSTIHVIKSDSNKLTWQKDEVHKVHFYTSTEVPYYPAVTIASKRDTIQIVEATCN